MFGSYAELLDQLVAAVEYDRASDGRCPVVLDSAFATRDFFRDRPSEEEFAALLAEVSGRFREVLAAVEGEWGYAEFGDGQQWRQLGLPSAIEAAAWVRGGDNDVIATVYSEHQDTELPIELVLGAFDLRWLQRRASGHV